MRQGFMDPRIWVVVPFSRPENKTNVLDNFVRQRYAKKGLVIVENGDGIGTFAHGGDVTHLMISPTHQSHAKNRAIEFLQEKYPDDYWVCMDDDDYYGREYLQEHADFAERGVIRGKRNAWMEFDSTLVYFGHHWEPDTDAQSFVGGTMGSYLTDAQEFPLVTVGEEAGFCQAARDAGLKVKTTTQSNFCYNRRGNPLSHTYQAPEERMWRSSGGTGIRVLGSKRVWVMKPPPSVEPREYWETDNGI